MTEDDVKKFENIIEQIEKAIDEQRVLWNNTLITLSNKVKNGNPKDLVDIQAEAVSQRQNILEELYSYLVKINKDASKKKSLFKTHYEFYKTKYPVKQSTGETAKLIESDLYLHDRKINLYEVYVDYLRETAKNFDAINFFIKNKITLISTYGID